MTPASSSGRRYRSRTDGARIHRIAHTGDSGAGGFPGPESSLLKIKGTELQQATQELLMEISLLPGCIADRP